MTPLPTPVTVVIVANGVLAGCRFEGRACSLAVERCRAAMPDLESVGAEHFSRCFRADEVQAP